MREKWTYIPVMFLLTILTSAYPICLVESQRDEARKDGVQRGGQVEEIQSERNELRNSVVTLQASIKRLESDREDVIKCLEEARKRIAGKSCSTYNRSITS